MFDVLKRIFNKTNELKRLKYQLKSLREDLLFALSISEKYFSKMALRDVTRLIILRRIVCQKK